MKSEKEELEQGNEQIETKWIVPPGLRSDVENFVLLYKAIKGTKKQPGSNLF